MNQRSKQLAFKVSSGLKNIIGKDLISDRFIAIFELVKNSYDAGASKVKINFDKDKDGQSRIIISDDGCGMNYNDIINKWLFVAYSEKKKKNVSYREDIKREVAGAKGVGRFSCDRLGEKLRLMTKTINDKDVHVVDVNWSNFEIDDTKEFMQIPVNYSVAKKLPNSSESGTTLIIEFLREEWDRTALLRLKRSLMKLISPEVDKGENPFCIDLIVPREEENDRNILKNKKINPERDIVNGIIRNDVFEKLNIKTTNIKVEISKDGKFILTQLFDRGEFIFEIKEKNRKYILLKDICISIFYLNRSAKMSFTMQMGGVQPLKYGSVFIYKNGFRINPFGEPGQDFFNIDQRKAQGWKRFLGTREIMGRISINGSNEQFIETSSRAHGFVQTEAVNMLGDFFLEKVLKVLEKYVVNIISWGEPLKHDPLKHVIDPSEVGDQIIEQFISNIDTKNIISINYNKDILTAKRNNEDNDNIVFSLKKLEHIAEQTRDIGFINLAKDVKKRTETILSQNLELEKTNTIQSKDLEKSKKENLVREKQVYFLKGAANQNVENLINGFHSIYTLTEATKVNISYLKELLSELKVSNKNDIIDILVEIYQSNQKANKLAELAIKGNQNLKQTGRNSISDFIKQYIDSGMAVKGLNYKLMDNNSYYCRFDPSSISIVFDNVVSNSIKAGANNLEISFIEKKNNVEINFSDDGLGLDKGIDPINLFEWGVSTSVGRKGFGIGLYHIKLLVEEMNGTVSIDEDYTNGFRLVVSLRK